MKLIIQIPCFNEEVGLPVTFQSLPTQINGIDEIETQVIDDGSTDRTGEIANELKIKHIISFKNNKGLAAAFKAGLDNAIRHHADILVNTDADNQYCGQDIEKLIEPILRGNADIVVGCRPIKDHMEFPWYKKLLQRIGSEILRRISGTTVRDAASGFRAYSQDAMLRLNVYSNFSYCMETLIQAGLANIKIESIDIQVNPKLRESRLFRNLLEYIIRSASTMISIFLVYRAKIIFFGLSTLFFLSSIFLFVRYLVLIYFFHSPASRFWPTVILSGVLLIMGLQTLFTGLLSSLIGVNRQISEEIVYRIRKLELEEGKKD